MWRRNACLAPKPDNTKTILIKQDWSTIYWILKQLLCKKLEICFSYSSPLVSILSTSVFIINSNIVRRKPTNHIKNLQNLVAYRLSPNLPHFTLHRWSTQLTLTHQFFTTVSMQHFHSRRFPSRFPRCATENGVDRASVGAGRKEGWGGGYRRTGSSSGSTAQPTNSKRGGETRGGGEGRGRQRSRANPFKSTQLRQWGFICYLGGHIVSRRERTDRLRRASDGLAPGEPVPTRNLAPGERLLSGPLLFILRPFLPLLATLPRGPTPLVFAHYRYQNRQRRRHPPEKRIRRYTSLLEIFLPWLSVSLPEKCFRE